MSGEQEIPLFDVREPEGGRQGKQDVKGIVSRDWGELKMIPVDSLEVLKG